MSLRITRRRLLIGTAAGLGLACGGGWLGWRLYEERLLQECRRNITDIGRHVRPFEKWSRDEEGFPLWPEELEGIPEEWMICPAAGKPYVYSPVTAAGERVRVGPDKWNQFVLWCPEPAHRGRRVLMLSCCGSWVTSDACIDWERQIFTPGVPVTRNVSPEIDGRTRATTASAAAFRRSTRPAPPT